MATIDKLNLAVLVGETEQALQDGDPKLAAEKLEAANKESGYLFAETPYGKRLEEKVRRDLKASKKEETCPLCKFFSFFGF